MDYKTLKMDGAEVEGRTIIGYASTFGNRDLVGDIVVAGAFKKTLSERKPKVFYNHMYPIGSPVEIHEDSKGLYTESKMSRTPRGDEILELVKDGVINEMSIAYEVLQYEDDSAKGVRYLKELKLFEYGPVDFPANENAVIEGVKTLADRLRRGKKLDSGSIESINVAIDTLKQILSLSKGEPSDNDTHEPSLIDTQWIAELGDLVHELSESARV